MALIPNPTPGTVLQQGVPKVPIKVPATGNPGLAFNQKFVGSGGAVPAGATFNPNTGAIIARDTSFAGIGDTIVQHPDGSKTVLMKNGTVVTIPGGPAAPEGGGGGGGGGGGSSPPPLKKPPPVPVQKIPGPKAVGASSLGAPNQTWDWLLEMLAAPGLLSPMMQQLGTFLAQPSQTNEFLPQVSQPNWGGLFGTPTSPAPFTQQPAPSFISNILGNTPWQGSTLGPSAFSGALPGVAPASGSVNLGGSAPQPYGGLSNVNLSSFLRPQVTQAGGPQSMGLGGLGGKK